METDIAFGHVAPRVPADWYPAPVGCHELRYWDGAAWTDQVSDGHVPSTDSLDEPPGDVARALAALIAVLVVNGTMMSLLLLVGLRYRLAYDLVAPALAGLAVALDARRIGRSDITGPPALWWAATTVFLGIAIPVYLFRRPVFLWRASRIEAPTHDQLLDPTNPFANTWD